MDLYFWIGKYADDPSWDELAETGQLGPATAEFNNGRISFHYDYKAYIPPPRFEARDGRLVENTKEYMEKWSGDFG